MDAPTAPPPMLATLVHDYAQKLLTIASTGLLAKGIVTQAQDGQLIQLGVGAAMLCLSVGWTYVAAKVRTARLAAAIAAPAVPALPTGPFAAGQMGSKP